MDVIEARTDHTVDLDIQRQWRLRHWSDGETGVFWKVTIQEVGEEDNTVDIWIISGENTIGTLANNTFHVGSEQDGNSIDWTNTLFR